MNARDYHTRAKNYADQGKYSEAIADYNTAIKLDPNNPDYYSNRGVAYFRLKKYDEAVADESKAIELNPLDDVPYANRGAALYWQNKYSEALLDYSKTIELNSTESAYYTARGVIYYQQGRYSEAMVDCNKAIELGFLVSPAYDTRGLIYFRGKKFDEAIADYKKAIELNPRCIYTNSYKNRGDAYSQQGKFSEAIADYSKAIEDNPKAINSYIGRAKAYQNIGQVAQSFNDQEKIYQLTKCPSLKDMCKFFILSNHGKIIARNGIRHFIDNTSIDPGNKSVTDALRETLEQNNITPDTIDLKRKAQGLITGVPTLFDEIRKEEKFYLNCQLEERATKRQKMSL
jgi:tetratricopeptide (TPR) repeat protein